MSFFLKMLIFCFMIIQAKASHIDEQMQQKLEVINTFRKADIDPKYKVGLDELEKLATDILPKILPNLPVDDPTYAETFQNNYRTIKLPIIKKYMNNDFLVFRMGISKYYSDKPETHKEILNRMTQLFKEYNQDSYTCLDHLEFIGKLVYISENKIFGNNMNNLTDSIESFKKSIVLSDRQALPFPLHTRYIEFDGIYGEATIIAGMIIGMWPIMYVSRPDAVADVIVHGPIETTWHDLGAHYLTFINNPIWFLKMPGFIINHPKIDNDLVEYLFNQFHEGNNMNFITLALKRQELFPFYLDLINYVITAVSKEIPRYKDIQTINIEELNSILNNLQKNHSSANISDILNYYILGPGQDIFSDSTVSNEEKEFLSELFLGRSVNDGLRAVQRYKEEQRLYNWDFAN